MPFVEITLIEGRPPEMLRGLIHEVHEAVVRAVGAPSESIRVVLREVPATNWAAGDVTIAERRAAAAADQSAEQKGSN
jgi:4-oxalocrotonate tautomerase